MQSAPPSFGLRILLAAWIAPAAMLVWGGLVASGVGATSTGVAALGVRQAQVVAVLLVIFTVPVAVSRVARGGHPLRVDTNGLRVHAWLGACSLGLVALATLAPGWARGLETVAPGWSRGLETVAAVAGFAGAIGAVRWIRRTSAAATDRLSALTVGVAFQLTIGWLLLPGASPLPSAPASATADAWVGAFAAIAQGGVLAWGAVVAAWGDPFPPVLAATSAVPTVGEADVLPAPSVDPATVRSPHPPPVAADHPTAAVVGDERAAFGV